MKPCPTEVSLHGAHLTGRCSVTVCQYAACLGGPICTLSGPNTFFLLPFICSFSLIFPRSFQRFFLVQSDSSSDLIPFYMSPPHICFFLSLCLIAKDILLVLCFISHIRLYWYRYWFCFVYTFTISTLLFARWLSLSVHKLKVAPFLPCLLTVTFCGLLNYTLPLLLTVTVPRYVILLPFGDVV